MITTAKLFMHNRDQAVRLPKEFWLPGSEVRISKIGNRLLLEPVAKLSFDVKAWRTKLRELGAVDFLAEG